MLRSLLQWLRRLWNRLRNPNPTPLYVGDTLGTKEVELHKHKRGNCGRVWEHSDACAGQTEAHTCPDCGREEWMRYSEDEASEPAPYPSYSVPEPARQANEEENPFLFHLN